MQPGQLARLLQQHQIVAVEGAGEGIVAGEVIEPLVEAVGSQVGEGGQQHKENSEQGRRGLAEHGPHQRQQGDVVHQSQRGIGDCHGQLQCPLPPLVFVGRLGVLRHHGLARAAGQHLMVLIEQQILTQRRRQLVELRLQA